MSEDALKLKWKLTEEAAKTMAEIREDAGIYCPVCGAHILVKPEDINRMGRLNIEWDCQGTHVKVSVSPYKEVDNGAGNGGKA